MKIGIIGSGSVGTALAASMGSAGHDVVVGSRSSAENKPLDAAKHGDIVILAIHYHAIKEAITPMAGVLAGKVVVDATNPLNSDWSPLVLGFGTSAGEEVQKLLPDCYVVKAFNTVFADVMHPSDIEELKITAFIASNHEEALGTVATLALDCGSKPVTVNNLAAVRYLEAMAHLNIELAIGQSGGTKAAFSYFRSVTE